MNILVVLLVIVALIAINIVLWKFGFIHDAQVPKSILDRPTLDPKERKAILKRLKRWREEGRLSRQEFELFLQLCDSEWDPSSEAKITP